MGTVVRVTAWLPAAFGGDRDDSTEVIVIVGTSAACLHASGTACT
jgi:hypothetical protein